MDLPERVGVAGSGAIACGVARVVAEHGDVVLWARSEESATRAGQALGEGSSAEVATDLDVLGECSLVVECIAEDIEAKSDLLGKLGSLLGGDALLATSTSSLSVAVLAEASGRPDRFAGLHVFNPVEKMELVEIAFAPGVAEDTRARINAFTVAIGKTAIEVPDVPGFVVNRLLFPFLFSAVELLDEHSLSPEDVDECLKLGAGHPMGPLALLDFVGLDVAAAIGESIGANVPEHLTELVSHGKLGRKSGAGFYDYG